MALFKMSQAELADAFVRERFKEPLVFGSPDIKEQLNRQRISTYPSRAWWRSIVTRDCRFVNVTEQKMLALLKHCAHPDSLPFTPHHISWPMTAIVKGMLERPYIQSLLDKIDRDRVRLFLGEDCIILHEPNTATPLVWTEHNDKLMPAHLHGRYVAGVLLASWSRQTPVWYQARAALCDLLSDDIAEEEMKARKEFGNSVAVSKDGTAIIQADEVWVFEGKDITHICVYEPSQFFDRKILRKPNLIRTDGDPMVDDIMSMTGCDENTQLLFTNPSNRRRIFVTNAKFCPRPLPEPVPCPLP